MRLYHLKTFFFFFFEEYIEVPESRPCYTTFDHFNADLVLAAISGMVFVPVLKLSDIM